MNNHWNHTRVVSVVMDPNGVTYVMWWPHARDVTVSLDYPFEEVRFDTGFVDARPSGPPDLLLSVDGVGEMIVARTFEEAMRAASQRWAEQDAAQRALAPATPELPER